MKDDSRAMRTVFETFEACFRVLEQGEAIGFFPEGLSHDDPQLKTVKTGAASMALELEHRCGGKLGLHLVPVGLTFSAKERYRSEVLVPFGERICVADVLAAYPEKKHNCIHTLTAEIERRIEALILHLPRLERGRIVEAVKRLYLDRLILGNRVIHEPGPPKAGELLLTRAIAHAVDFTFDHHPERAATFTRKLGHSERWLRRFNLAEAEPERFPDRIQLVWQSLARTLLGVALFPVALYGWLHRLRLVLFMRWAVQRFAQLPNNKARVSTTAILAGVASFGVCYGACIAIVHALFGLPVSFWCALSLPVASLGAHPYVRGFFRFALGVRFLLVRLRAPTAPCRLRVLRDELIAKIDAARWQLPPEALTPEWKVRS